MLREIITVALGLAIYVQTAGAFVWLIVVVLLERARREDRARLLFLEQTVQAQGRRMTGIIDHLTCCANEADSTRPTDRFIEAHPCAWFCSKCNKLFCIGPDHPDGFEPPRDFCNECGHRLELRDYP